MKTQHAESQRWEDIVFEHRNKSYGAYAIRRNYHDRMMKGMLVAVGIFAVAFILPKTPKIDIKSGSPLDSAIVIIDTPTIIPTPPENVIKPPAQPASKNIIPTHVTTLEVKGDSTKDIPNTQATPIGNGTSDNTTVLTTGTGTEVIEVPEVTKPDFLFTAEIMPSYEGGISEMMNFLRKKLRYPVRASRMGVEGTVYVSFVVDAEGDVTRVEVIKGIDPECDREAAKVIAMMSLWHPAMQNKQPVSVKMVLPIKFALGR